MNNKGSSHKRMNATDVVHDIKVFLDSQTPTTEGDTIARDLAKRVFSIFFDVVLNPKRGRLGAHDQDLLFCFSYFLCNDSEFCFTRTYLNGKAESFQNCMESARQVLALLLTHFNRLTLFMGEELKDFILVYNELFSFVFDCGEGRWVARLQYTKLSNLIKTTDNVFQVYKSYSNKPPVLVYTSTFTEKTKEDRRNLKTIIQSCVR